MASLAVGLGAFGTAAGAATAPTDNPYFAGYATSGTSLTVNYTATVVVPTVSCAEEKQGMGNPVGIDAGFSVTPDGGLALGGGQIRTNCLGPKRPQYSGVIFVNGNYMASVTVSAGDTVVITGHSAPKKSSFSLDDLTSGKTLNYTVAEATGKAVVIGAQGQESSQALSQGFYPFTPIMFSKVMIDGKPFTDSDPAAFDETDAVNQVTIATSPVYGDKAFHLTDVGA